MDKLGATFVTVFGMLITLATVAILLSQRAQTASVLSALGSSVGSAIGAATAPITASQNN